MSAQWISAVAARALVAAQSNNHAAEIALCTRAHIGMLKAKAQLIVMGKESRKAGLIPPAFWWPQGHAALVQNWEVGDFSVWINNSECRAFGVCFDLDGVREMLPPERAAIITRELSVAGNAEWLAADEARRFVHENLGTTPSIAEQILFYQCRLGFVAARAVRMQRADGENPDDWTDDEREWDVPGWYWENLAIEGRSSQDWETGLFTGHGLGPNGLGSIMLHNMHFLRTSIEALRPAKIVAEAIVGAVGGRLPAVFWDDLWCAIWGDIYRGDFKPKLQADVERAMLNWAITNGHDLSETAAKQRARKLFTEYNREGTNL